MCKVLIIDVFYGITKKDAINCLNDPKLGDKGTL